MLLIYQPLKVMAFLCDCVALVSNYLVSASCWLITNMPCTAAELILFVMQLQLTVFRYHKKKTVGFLQYSLHCGCTL